MAAFVVQTQTTERGQMMRRRSVVREAFDPTVSPMFGKPAGLSGADLRFRLISDEYCAVLQRSREELLNIEWPTIVHPDDLAAPAAKQAILLATGEPYDVTCRVRRNDGRWLRGRFRVNRITTGPGLAPLVQSNAWFELIQPETTPPTGSDTVLAEYIQVICAELAKLADGKGLLLLQQLLSMASLEAAEEIGRHYPGIIQRNLPDRLN